MGRKLLFLGPPGAGKGTQAAMLARAIGIPHISTGDMLRRAVAAGTPLGRRAEAIMATGDLVPDDLVTAIVLHRLAEEDTRCGYLLDGFPRNPVQAETLRDELSSDEFDAVILLDVGDDELITRLLKRATEEGRVDDTREVVARRLAVYREQTEPLVAFYTERGLLTPVGGVGGVDEVFARIVRTLAG